MSRVAALTARTGYMNSMSRRQLLLIIPSDSEDGDHPQVKLESFTGLDLRNIVYVLSDMDISSYDPSSEFYDDV